MADFENIASIRGPKLSDLAEHVFDVLALNLSEEDEFQVGQLAMASYHFVPYALAGLAAAMETPSTGVRATTDVTLPLSDDKGDTDSATQEVTLYGPGDVLGVDAAQIVRRYPSPGSTNAEETFHAHIEFDRTELPWAFSAHAADDRMPAWLALVVFERDEVEWEAAQSGLQPVVSVPATLLPPLATAWAWAHAQTVQGSASLSARLSTAYGPVNVSRLLAARVLTQNTNYVACLVPTTDAGVKAGLGTGGGTLGPAWTSEDGAAVRLPVYDRWEFRTAPEGDFARLARRLEGVAAPWEIGRRIMDASRPGEPLDELGPNDAGRRQVIRCALYSPASQPPDARAGDDASWSAARIDDLKDALELPALIEGAAGTDPGGIPNLPIVGPRIYAKGQRGLGTIPPGDWFSELNLTLSHRVVSGLGTRVVQMDQEPLMQAAWAQVGEVEKANHELALAELARRLATTIHARLDKIDAGRLLQLTRPVAPRIRLEGVALTLAGQTARSATPAAALGGSFRRTLRAAGPVARRLAVPDRVGLARVVAENGVPRDFTRPYVELDGIRGLSAEAIETLDAQAVALALTVPPNEALGAVQEAAGTLVDGPSLATALTTPELWREPNLGFRPGQDATERVVTRIQHRIPDSPGREVVRARWLGGLASGVAVSGAEGTAGLLDVALGLERTVGTSAARVAAGGLAGVAVAAPPPRPAAATMLRGVSARGTPVSVGISGPAAGSLMGSISRPSAPEAGAAAAVLTDRERLDRFRTPQGTVLGTWVERAQLVTVTDVRAQLGSLVEAAGALALPTTPERAVLAVSRDQLLQRLEPTRTVIDAMRARVSLGRFDFDVFAESVIRPIMAAPRFDRPMYQALDTYDREWLVPGLGTLPEPELVTLLSTNDAFTEAFLVGLSDEMGRELLWREYPTDARGTYFYRFWDGTKDELAQQIHRFQSTKLGSHLGFGPEDQSGRAVVVIRGEIVRRYPDMTVMALRELGRDDENRPLLPEAPTGPPDAARALFHAMLPPDILLVGLDITIETLRTPGWWIVLAEHPQATRFRRKEPDLAGHEVEFASPGSSANGATVAASRLENPTRIAFEAGDFLP